MFVSIFLICASVSLFAQTSIEDMQQKRDEIKRQIAASQKLLNTTDSDIKGQVANLNVITARLKEIQKLLAETRKQVTALTRQSEQLTRELEELRSEYAQCQDQYAEACRFYQHQRTSFNPLLFLFSSKDYRQLSRRVRYIREYSTSLDDLGEQIAEKQAAVESKKAEIDALMAEKLALQTEQTQLETDARNDEQAQRSIVTQLQSKSASLKKEISEQQREMNALSNEIDRQIRLALEAEKKSKSGNSKTAMNQPQADPKLTGSFESNKGKLPMPITGPYLITGDFGMQNVAGMKDVKLNNLGIDIQGEAGAKARSVFDGTVTTIFQQGKGQIGVLVRHGKYISVYCNLSSTTVRKGDNLKTGDIVGNIAQDSEGRTLLHFQLHKETEKLNPSLWLRN